MTASSAASNYELPFVAEFYDYLPHVAGRKDVDFYRQFARASGGPVLELGCGTGRVLLPLAQDGLRVTGLDLSEQMLARCRAKLGREPAEVQKRVRLIRGDMRSFDLREAFALVTIPFRPFQHLLSVGDQLDCLRAVRRHLAPGGRFILDLFHTDARRMHDPAFLEESEPFPAVRLPDGREIRRAERVAAYHRAEQINDVEQIFYVTHADGRRERFLEAFPMRYFFRYEVGHLLGRAGFRVAELYGDFDRSPLTDSSPEMIFVAEADKLPRR